MTDEQILSFIKGKLSKAERQSMLTWIKESPENLDRVSKLQSEAVFSTMPDKTLPEKKRWTLYSIITTAAAAALLPVIAFALFTHRSDKKLLSEYSDISEKYELVTRMKGANIEYRTYGAVKGKVLLPDSSVVWLNSESSLVCPQVFDSDKREISLSGEGFFEVHPDSLCPMYIKTPKGVMAKVTGTTFNLSAYNDDKEIKLTLLSGKVALIIEKNNQEIPILPHQKLELTEKSDKGMEKTPQMAGTISDADEEADISWKDGILLFRDTPMDEVIRKIERWYGVDVDVRAPEVYGYNFTANFSSEPIHNILELIKTSLSVDYTLDKNKVVIY